MCWACFAPLLVALSAPTDALRLGSSELQPGVGRHLMIMQLFLSFGAPVGMCRHSPPAVESACKDSCRHAYPEN
eukprot:9246695-Alexandrium_andersonii.AAC.1